MTVLNVNLSPALQQTLGQPGVYAYAVFFDSNGNNPQVTQLAAGPGHVNSGTTPIELPQPYNGGKVYFIIQSVAGNQSTLFGPNGVIQQEADIDWQNAAQYDFRFDSFEVSLLGNAGDAGNLTEVNGFGIPMAVTVAYQDGSPTQTRGYNLSGNGIFQQIASFSSPLVSYPFSAGPLAIAGEQRMALSPTEAVGLQLPGASAADWNNYLSAIETFGSGTIEIAGYFNGAPSADAITFGPKSKGNQVFHNGGFFAYDLSYSGGYFELTPEPNSQIEGTIQISPDDLANSIYSTLGNATIMSGGTPYLDMNTGDNNQWGAVLVKFLVGFVGGYYGGTGPQLNPLTGSGGVDLDQNWNFDPTYAFGGGPSTSVTTIQHDFPTVSTFYDGYAKIFFDHSNAYGNGYSDALTAAFLQGGPLITVGNNNGTDVNAIGITLFDDNEPNAGAVQGYTAPVIYNVMSGPYVPLSGAAPSNLSLEIPVQLGQMALDPGDSVSFGVYTSTANSGTTSAHAVFDTMVLSSGGAGLYQSWTYTGTGLTAAGDPAFGNIALTDLPYSTGVNWYELTISNSSAGVSRTYDIYLSAVAGSGVLNPAYTGANQSASIAVDNLATYVSSSAANRYLSNVEIGLAVGGNLSMDPRLMGQILDSSAISANSGTVEGNWPTPTAPVLGRLTGLNTFTGLFLPTPAAGTGPQTTPLPQTVAAGDFLFGWAGADSAAMRLQAWNGNFLVKGPTNKIQALGSASGAFAEVFASGRQVGGQLLSGGQEFVDASAGASGIVVNGATLQVYGNAFSTTLENGGTEDVNSGGIDSGAKTIGGSQEVHLGGLAVSAIVSSGAQLIFGSASATLVSGPGASAVVEVGGVTTGTAVSSGGTENVAGIASATIISSGGAENVLAGGVASAATVLNGGSQTVFKHGTASSTIVSSGGQEIVSSGASAVSGTVRSGGQETVNSGGTASATTVGGTEVVFAGGQAVDAMVLSGATQVLRGGTATSTTVASGGVETISAGTATAMTVSGSAVVSSGGTANATVIDSGGYELVMSGGLVSGATLSGGTLEIKSGGLAASSTITFATTSSSTLVLDDTKFRGKIAGFTGSGSATSNSDAIDLAALSDGATLGYVGNTLSGTLTVSDGSHTVKLTMLGNFVQSNFSVIDDGGGHAMITYSATAAHPGG
jgi:autotransporter passenger strand-loop-strand repeat protein